MKFFKIGDKTVGKDFPTFIIAEACLDIAVKEKHEISILFKKFSLDAVKK